MVEEETAFLLGSNGFLNVNQGMFLVDSSWRGWAVMMNTAVVSPGAVSSHNWLWLAQPVLGGIAALTGAARSDPQAGSGVRRSPSVDADALVNPFSF